MRTRRSFIIFIDFGAPVLNLPIRRIPRVANGVKKYEENFALNGETERSFSAFDTKGGLLSGDVPTFLESGKIY